MEGGEKGRCDLVCGALVDDWLMLVYDDVLFMCGECVFIFWRSLSFYKE